MSAPSLGGMDPTLPGRRAPLPLYSEAERKRRDTTVWTLVQGVLAPVQFLVFLVSLVLGMVRRR